MQKTINFAKKNGYEVKISQKGTRVSFYNPRYDHSVETSIYKDGGELWVNFHDDNSGMSGNDPIGDFYGTFANAYDSVKDQIDMYPNDDDDLDEGVKTDTMQYKISHGKEPKGRGGWYFSPHSAIDFAKHKEGDDYISSGNDSYSDAKKQAAQWAKSKGHKKMYVLPEGAKVDRMVKHIKSSEKKSGKSDKDSESIAWATLNKRGMLDNANKKKGK